MSTVYDVAVVGSRGFLGSAVASELERRGANVGRFTKDQPYVVNGELAANCRAVVWAAGHVTPADASSATEALDDLSAFIEAALCAPRHPHLVLLSSGGAVYGPPGAAPYRETNPPAPVNDYGRLKLAEERTLQAERFPHTVLRLANPYGAAQVTGGRGQGVIGAWMSAVLAGEPVTMFGDGGAVRDYVFIEDAAAAIATAAERTPGGVLNIGSGKGTSLAELLEVVRGAVAPRTVDVQHEPARDVDPAANWLEVSRASEVLEWTATTSLADGVASTWATVSA